MGVCVSGGGGGGGECNLNSSWGSLNNTKTVKAVTMAFCSIQWKEFSRNIRAKFGIPSSSHSPDIGKNSDGDISDFWIQLQKR